MDSKRLLERLEARQKLEADSFNMSVDDLSCMYGELCNLYERIYHDIPDDEDCNYTSDEARAFANKVMALLTKYGFVVSH